MKSIDSLKPGAHARIVRLGGERAFRRRLMELGLLPGSRLKLVRRADVGDVLELEVRRARVTVRRSEAREIEVDQIEPAPIRVPLPAGNLR